MVRGAAGAAAANVVKKYKRMKIDLQAGGGSCVFERLKFMRLKARGVKGVKPGNVVIELNPEDYKAIEMEDRVNHAVFDRMAKINLDNNPSGIQKIITCISRLMVIGGVPFQVLGVGGGLVDRAVMYNREADLMKAFENLGLGGLMDLEKLVNMAAAGAKMGVGTYEKDWNSFSGKTGLEERGLKSLLAGETSEVEAKLERIKGLM